MNDPAETKPWLAMVTMSFYFQRCLTMVSHTEPWSTMLHNWSMIEQSGYFIVNHGQPCCIAVTMVSYLIKTTVTMVNHACHHSFNQVSLGLTIIIHDQLTGDHGLTICQVRHSGNARIVIMLDHGHHGFLKDFRHSPSYRFLALLWLHFLTHPLLPLTL